MTAVMEGVRVLEVAEHTFVPAASALLADWGAEIIKIEHVERGDAMRGLASSGLAVMGDGVHPLLEHSNRGKKSLALDLTTDEGLELVYRLAETCDIFLTNKLASVRTKLKIDVDDIRARNPKMIYVRGSGQGERGPEADRGSYDMLSYWCRSGIAVGVMRDGDESIPAPPGPAFGDSIGAMTIAGGIMGALYHRERTGEATVVDVSLLGVGLWSHGAALALSLTLGVPWGPMPRVLPTGNPLVSTYKTKDDRFISMSCLQPGKYWPPMCDVIDRPDLVTDERFKDAEGLRQNSAEGTAILAEIFLEHTADEWRDLLADFPGQWAVVQSSLEAAADPQTVANGYIVEHETAEGRPFQLAAAPIQYDEVVPSSSRAPEFNEHGDDILTDLGLDMDAIIDLKVRGVVA